LEKKRKKGRDQKQKDETHVLSLGQALKRISTLATLRKATGNEVSDSVTWNYTSFILNL
jgi:hypothetical protein